MNYFSTRRDQKPVQASAAILNGIAPDGGLYVPERIPRLDEAAIGRMRTADYPARACEILRLFLDDFSDTEVLDAVRTAYSEERFGEKICPLVQLNRYSERAYILELWHGPSSAFKDFALQLLPYLMDGAASHLNDTRERVILTATSGDTGKAALEAFADHAGYRLVVFYPKDGVSEQQERQMLSAGGSNVSVVAVRANFDEVQSGVKALFADAELAAHLAERNQVLSSANSINWGRLLPQIVYYWSAYLDLLNGGHLEVGETLNFAVPTGNFGDILAAWYAAQMGLPVHKLICASNMNNVLSDFFRSGVYDIRRDFHRTLSPSMDILISSNLERLLYELSCQNASYVGSRMEALRSEGVYSVGPEMLNRLQETFVGGYTDDRGCLRTILNVYDDYDHLVDPHTAVAFNVYERYAKRAKDEHKVVYISTASPLKFPETVCQALYPRQSGVPTDLQGRLERLSEESGLAIPETLNHLTEKAKLHDAVCAPEEMRSMLLQLLDRDGGGAGTGPEI